MLKIIIMLAQSMKGYLTGVDQGGCNQTPLIKKMKPYDMLTFTLNTGYPIFKDLNFSGRAWPHPLVR